MRRIAILGLVVGSLVPLLVSNGALAQATRTFISGVGNDADPCSRTAPCRTFAGAISKTFINGEINCLDPGGFGTVNITKSITLDCTGTFGSVLASGTTGIIVNIPVNVNDPLRTVRIRGLTINGTGASGAIGTRTGVRGINIVQGSSVIIEDTVISDFSQQGILDSRTAPGGKLFIRNSVIRNNAGSGIVVTGVGATTNASIENVHSINNAFGVAVGSGNKVQITRSVFSGNTTAGVEADAGGSVGLDTSTVSGNAQGLQNAGSMSFSNSNITFNATGISGATTSFGNNRIFGNTAPGTAPTVGAATSDHGQQ
jgi:hypothetical protein